jgi:hypothetical protein
MTKHSGKIAIEWTMETMDKHNDQLQYLKSIGYTKFRLQFIEDHLLEPDDEWQEITDATDLEKIRQDKQFWWVSKGWKRSNLRPTADVGMLWVI